VDIVQIGFVNGKGDYGGAITSKAKSLTLYNCSFINNLANYGAGVYQNGDRLSIENSVFTHNYAASKGGAVYANYTGKNSPLVVKSCKFYRNNVTNIGAAIYAECKKLDIESSELSRNGGTTALYASNSSVLLRECNVSANLGPNNMRQNGHVGGIGFDNFSAVIEECAVLGNKATYLDNDENFTQEYWGFGGSGGGIYLSHSNVTINDTSINENEAFTAGGIDVAESNLVVNRCSISNNTAQQVIIPEGKFNGQGGGMFMLNSVAFESNHADNLSGAIANSGQLTLIGANKFLNNTAHNAGAIYNHEGCQVKIKGTSYFIKNQADEERGALWDDGISILNECDITDNDAWFGGGIFSEGNAVVTINDGRIERNHAAYNGGGIYNRGTVNRGWYSLAGNNPDDRFDDPFDDAPIIQ